MIVVDASVIVKWYFDEPGSDAAIALQDGRSGRMIAPDLLAVEVCGALVRDANMLKRNRPGIREAVDDFRRAIEGGFIDLFRTSIEVTANSAALAIELGHPLKDCIYLGLAMSRECPLLTADARFAEKARHGYADIKVLAE